MFNKILKKFLVFEFVGICMLFSEFSFIYKFSDIFAPAYSEISSIQHNAQNSTVKFYDNFIYLL